MNEMIISAPGAALTARPQLADMLGRFLDFVNVKDVTAKSYGVCLRCFGEWAANNAITAPTRRDILDYVEWLALPHARRQRTDRASSSQAAAVITFSAGTQARYLRAVKLFFRWTAQEGLFPNVADNVKGAKVRADNTKRDPLQRDDARALLDSIDTTTDAGKRDFAMIDLALSNGLRIIEIQRACIGNLELIAGKHILYVWGKGHSEADDFVVLADETYNSIMAYLNTRSTKDPAAPLFASTGNRSSGQRMTEPSISRIFKQRLRAAGFDSHRISAHSTRHTSVTLALKAGATLQEAQHHARHASPVTTENVYAHNIEKLAQNTAQRVRDYIYGVETDVTTQAADCLKRMTADQQQRALELLRAIAG